jgi:glycosyltransferase involved in cell wall biosynthesis
VAKFSIVLPVRNGGEHIKLCIKSILSQTYADFNLLILDNKSTDGTTEWIATIKDERVKTFLSSESLSIEDNWRRITTAPKNEFITLTGHDDIFQPDYLQTMNDLVVQHPEASLYLAHFSYIDVDGNKIRDCVPMDEKEMPGAFLTKYLENTIDLMGTGFIMRAKDYDAIGGIPMYPNLLFADFELWINLAKKNYMAVAKKNCFAFRIHASTTKSSADERYHRAFERFINYLVSLREERTEFAERIRQSGPVFLFFYCRGFCHRLLRTPMKKRQGFTVKKTIGDFSAYAERLGIGSTFKPEAVFSIRLAKWIDSNPVTRFFFLTFKKIYAKPVIRK